MNMETNNKLIFMLDLTNPDVKIKALPQTIYSSVANRNGCFDEAWEWIMQGACGEKHAYAETDGAQEVFFIKEYSQPTAAAAVYVDGENAKIDFVATHPVGANKGMGRMAVDAALQYLSEQGIKRVSAEVDADCLPMAKICLNAGFELLGGDEAALREKLAAYKKPVREVLPLWADGNIPYFREGNEIPSIECYPVEGAKGAVVICPGGAYCMRASHEGGQIALMLNAYGISAYVLTYRVKPCHYEAPLSDAKRAIRTVKSMGYEQVAIMGFSAGGHLTCSAATLYDKGDAASDDPIERISSRPDAFVPCYPVVSFTTFRHHGSMIALLGEHAGNQALQRRFSAEIQVTDDTPPAFIWHTRTDDSVPVQNSLNLANALACHGVPFELRIYPNERHGLGLAKGTPIVGEWSDHCARWLLDMGYGK
jgi:acetyl esterase/lipase